LGILKARKKASAAALDPKKKATTMSLASPNTRDISVIAATTTPDRSNLN
jgi:hypothetical protein